jgi:tRNA threonylcarbamoyladenosine biosynthesis protein TsaE
VQSRTFRTRSEEETIALGRELAPAISPGAVLLIGNLGAGKTTLAKGIVGGLNATPVDEVSSPTFSLIHQYGEQYSELAPVYHIDLYRLDEQHQVENLGLDDLFSSGSVVLLEWAERFPALLPRHRTEIRLRTLPDEMREIEVSTID